MVQLKVEFFGSIIKVTAVASAKYAVEGIVLGSGTLATMFADA